MKKTIFLSAFLAAFLLAPASFGQVYFHEDFQNVVLDNKATADMDTLWTLYNDDNRPVDELAHLDKAWKIYGDAEGGRFAASPSYFKSSGKADRWLVTPAIMLTDAQNPVLVFRVKSLDDNNRDNLEVKISTTDSLKTSFATTLQTVNRARTTWNYYSVDLSEYKGQKIFLAFVQNSESRYVVGLDDIFVGEKRDNQMFIGGVSAPMAVVAQKFPYKLSVKAALYNVGDKDVSSISLTYSLDGGKSQNITASANIKPGAYHEISFEVSVDKAGYHTVNISMGNAPATQITSFVTLYTDLPKQRLMWEAFSSGMCTSCAPWNRVLHPVYVNLKVNDPGNSGNFVMAKYQVDIPAAGDPMVTPETNYTNGRAKYYNINAAPSFFMNGKRYQPKSYTSEQEIIEANTQALRDSIAAYSSRSSNLRLDARLTRDDNTFSVETSITTCFPDPDNYELVVVLLEDSIHQPAELHNGEQEFFSIVRKMMTSPSGDAITPAPVNESVKKSFTYSFGENSPRIFNGLDGVNAVAYLQNTRTREIIQALYMKASYPVANKVTKKTTNAHFDLYPNPADEMVNLRLESEKNQSLDVRVFNLAGTQQHAFKWNVAPGTNHTEINTSAWQAGTYLVGIYGAEGVVVKKLVLY